MGKRTTTGAEETSPEAKPAEGTEKPKKVKRTKKNVPIGIVHIHASFNNTLITITDPAGNTLSWSSSGAPFRSSSKVLEPGASPHLGPCLPLV
jgi:hypothetical protein